MNNTTQVYDRLRTIWVALTPEEHVRQLLICHLTDACHYPARRCASEKTLPQDALKGRFDLVVYGPDFSPWLLAECKAPSVEITNDTLYQLLRYHRTLQCPYWLLTNGRSTYCAHQSDAGITWLAELPAYPIPA